MTTFCTHDLDIGDTDLAVVVRVLRTLDGKFQQMVDGAGAAARGEVGPLATALWLQATSCG